jgi:hypothetical protein
MVLTTLWILLVAVIQGVLFLLGYGLAFAYAWIFLEPESRSSFAGNHGRECGTMSIVSFYMAPLGALLGVIPMCLVEWAFGLKFGSHGRFIWFGAADLVVYVGTLIYWTHALAQEGRKASPIGSKVGHP